MKRRLRIAVSVLFALLAVALCVLWVRSYWNSDGVKMPVMGPDHPIVIESARGMISFFVLPSELNSTEWRWKTVVIVKQVPEESQIRKWGLIEDRSFSGVVLPHRLLVLMSGILAAIFAVGFSKRFSLRTLLIATTLVAVVLGLIVLM